MYAIYEKGKCNLQTTVDSLDGICHFTNKTVDEYLKELGESFSCIPFDEALDLIHKAETSTFIAPWEEITVEDYHYWLEVLPPEKWKTVDGVNIFRLSEYTIGNITRCCATVKTRFGHRYFTADRRTSEPYKDIAEQINELTKEETKVFHCK